MYVISPKIHIIREGDQQMEARFFWLLVEDRASFQGGTYSYADFSELILWTFVFLCLRCKPLC